MRRPTFRQLTANEFNGRSCPLPQDPILSPVFNSPQQAYISWTQALRPAKRQVAGKGFLLSLVREGISRGFHLAMQIAKLVLLRFNTDPEHPGKTLLGKKSESPRPQHESRTTLANLMQRTLQIFYLFAPNIPKEAQGQVELAGWRPTHAITSQSMLEFLLHLRHRALDRSWNWQGYEQPARTA